jgi:hypothetical protein
MSTRLAGPNGWTAGAVAVLLSFVTYATAGTARAADDNAPITIQVKSPQEEEKGLSRVLTAAVAGNTLETAVAVERAMAGSRLVRVVPANPEALVYIDQRSRTETSNTDDKGNVTVTHTYRIQGMVDVGGLRSPLAVESQLFDSPGAYRDDPAQFSLLASQVASRALSVIISRLDALRPNRLQSGFTFQAKYRFGVKGDGLEVTSVTPGGPAEQAGLRVKDRIRSINGEKGTDQMSFLATSWWMDGPGRRYQIEYERDKRRQMGDLTLVAPGGSAAIAAAPAPAYTQAPAYATAPAAASSRTAGATRPPRLPPRPPAATSS